MKIFLNPRRRQDGGIWLIAFVVIGTVVVAGTVVWMMNHWKARLDDIQRRREQSITNEESRLILPQGVSATNFTIIQAKHWWEYDTNETTAVALLMEVEDSSSTPLLSSAPSIPDVRILHPVVTVGLSNNTLVLSLTNDGLWTTSSVPMVDKYGAPNPDLESGLAPVCDVYFTLERTEDFKVWKEVIRMGVSSNNPSMFRDVGVSWKDPHVFYRTRQD